MEIEENKQALEKYKDADLEKYAIELNIVQVAHLNKLMLGSNFRFQTEEFAKSKQQKLIRDLNKQNTVNTKNNDSLSSFTESESVKKKVPKPKVSEPKPKAPVSISEEMKSCLNNLESAKKETKTKLPNILSEIDFDSLQESITKRFLTSQIEFESQAKSIFSHVLKKYESSSSIHKILTNILFTWIGKKESVPAAPPKQPSKLPGLELTGAISAKDETKRAPMGGNETNHNFPTTGETHMYDLNPHKAADIPPVTKPTPASFEPQQLSKEEKRELGKKIKKLSQKYMRGIINIVSNENETK